MTTRPQLLSSVVQGAIIFIGGNPPPPRQVQILCLCVATKNSLFSDSPSTVCHSENGALKTLRYADGVHLSAILVRQNIAKNAFTWNFLQEFIF